MVLTATTLRRAQGRPWTAPLRWFGRHSYEIYLTHEWILVWALALYQRVGRIGPAWLWTLGILLASAPLGGVLARFYSEPLNRLLRGAPGSCRQATKIAR